MQELSRSLGVSLFLALGLTLPQPQQRAWLPMPSLPAFWENETLCFGSSFFLQREGGTLTTVKVTEINPRGLRVDSPHDPGSER